MKTTLWSLYLVIALILFPGTAYPRPFSLTGLEESGTENSPQWKPGTSQLAFLKENRFYLGDLESGKMKPVGRKGFPQLAFAWGPPGNDSFAVLAREAGGGLGLFYGRSGQLDRLPLVEFPEGGEGARFSRLSFSPDGREIIYSDNGVLYKIPARTGARPQPLLDRKTGRKISGAQSWGEFNPKRKEVIAFQLESNGREAVYIYHAGLKKIIGSVKGGFSACHPSWSPDGRKLAFFSNRSNKEKVFWGIWYLNYDDISKSISPPEPVSAGDSIRRKEPRADFTPIAWTPDSRKILYAAYGAGNGLISASLDSGRRKVLYKGEKIAIKGSRGYTTFWGLRIIHSDMTCACPGEGDCYVAFSAEVNIGKSTGKIIILETHL
ncbi:MAG: hypothetical protein ACE5GM_03680 [bacterium]